MTSLFAPTAESRVSLIAGMIATCAETKHCCRDKTPQMRGKEITANYKHTRATVARPFFHYTTKLWQQTCTPRRLMSISALRVKR